MVLRKKEIITKWRNVRATDCDVRADVVLKGGRCATLVAYWSGQWSFTSMVLLDDDGRTDLVIPYDLRYEMIMALPDWHVTDHPTKKPRSTPSKHRGTPSSRDQWCWDAGAVTESPDSECLRDHAQEPDHAGDGLAGGQHWSVRCPLCNDDLKEADLWAHLEDVHRVATQRGLQRALDAKVSNGDGNREHRGPKRTVWATPDPDERSDEWKAKRASRIATIAQEHGVPLGRRVRVELTGIAGELEGTLDLGQHPLSVGRQRSLLLKVDGTRFYFGDIEKLSMLE